MIHYWEDQKKIFEGNRLAWYGDGANEEFWDQYWTERITKSYYDNLTNVDLKNSDLGRTLLNEIEPGDSILEAGCGAGNWVSILNNNGYKNVLGIEYSSELVSKINIIKPELNVHWGDALSTRLQDASIDVYLSFGVVEHRFEGPDPFFIEANRILKPQGKAIITVPCVGPIRRAKALFGLYRDKIDQLPFFQFAFQKKELVSLLSRNGFRVLYVKFIDIDRLWIEEVKLYRTLSRYKTVRAIQKKIAAMLNGSDGHMALVVAEKSGDKACAD